MTDRRIHIRMLGAFEVTVDGEPTHPDSWRRRKATDLVKLLALSPHHRVPREAAMEAMWPGLPPERAGANLRKAAFHARRALGATDALVLDGAAVSFGAGWAIDTDVAEFESLARSGLSSGDEEVCRRAAAAYRGDLLADDRYEEWLLAHRERLRALYLQVLAGGKMWGRLVDEDPANEAAHQAILRRHLDDGDRAAALRRYESLRTALRDHLGVLPSKETMAMYDEALSLDAPDHPTPAERARALLAWGVVHWERQELAEADRTAAQARALAVDAGLGRELADASELMGLIAYAQGRWPQLMVEQLTETLGSAPEMTSFLLDANMCMNEFALFEPDGIHVVAELADQILAAATAAGSVQGKAIGLLLRGEAALLGDDDLTVATSDLAEAYRLHQQSQSVTGTALALERLAQIDTLAGLDEEADRLHRKALALAAQAPTRTHLIPFVYGGLLQGLDSAEASSVLSEAEEAMAEIEVCPPCAMSFRLEAARTHAERGRHAQAQAYLARAELVAEMWSSGPWHAAVKEIRAHLCLHGKGDREEAMRLLEEAALEFATASRPRDEARCRAQSSRLSATGDGGTVEERSAP